MNLTTFSGFRVVALPAAISITFLLLFTFLFGLHLPGLVDFLFCLFLVVLLHVFSRKNAVWVINAALVIVLVYLLGAMKLQYFGEPATLADVVSLAALYGLQTQGVQWLVNIVLVVLLVLFFSNLLYSKKLFVSSVCAVAALYSVVVMGSSVGAFSTYVNELSKSESVVLRQYHATVKFYDEWLRSPSPSVVTKASHSVTVLNDFSAMLDSTQKRDIYLIVIESLWDPSLLGKKQPHDPLHEDFRQLWGQSGGAYILGPTFGGGTANSEFEILCGIPLNSGFVVFEHPLLSTELPCLPNILGMQGYLSVASHPNRRNFWNRAEAYPALGFDRYFSINDFKNDEMVGSNYLSDRSLYRQHTELTKVNQGPQLHYILTASAHHPYTTTANVIALKNTAAESRRLLDLYVGLIKRSAKDVYDYIEIIRQRDRDALIVVVGDHPPLFGKDFAIYRDAGLLTNQKKNMQVDELLNIYSTPLLVVDGVNGPVNTNIKSMHEIPLMIINMLFCYQGGCNGASVNHTTHYRPVSGRGVLYYTDQQWKLCESVDSGEECKEHIDWLESMKIVRNATILGSLLVNSSLH